jgi:hypothetical protein
MDFTFNRVCDLHPVGSRVDGGLMVSVLTPLADDYELYNEGKCIGASGEEHGQVLIRLDDNEQLGRELRTYLKTDKYLRTHDDGTLPTTARRIHRDLAEENRHRRERLTSVLTELLVSGRYYVAGQHFEQAGESATIGLDAALEYLIRNTFNKMSFLAHLHENPLHEVQALLRGDDVAQQALSMDLPETNPQATQELRDYLELCARTSRKVVMHEMINDRFANRPYGWPALEVVLLLTRLYVAGEIQFLMGGAPIPRDRIYEPISTSSKWKNITVLQRVTADPQDVRAARELGRELFAEMGPDSEDGLYTFLRGKLEGWLSDLTGQKALADTGNYPGRVVIDAGLDTLRGALATQESKPFLQRFNAAKADLQELAESYHDLKNFYGPQKPTWDKLRAAYNRFTLNRMELERDDGAGEALHRMHEILTAPAPYPFIHEADELIRTAAKVNDALISAGRAAAVAIIDVQLQLVERDLTSAGGDQALREACLGPLTRLKAQTASQPSLAHLAQAEAEAVNIRDAALARIAQFQRAKAGPTTDVGGKPRVKPTHVIRAAGLAGVGYLETPEQVSRFVEALKAEMDEAVGRGDRIEIR